MVRDQGDDPALADGSSDGQDARDQRGRTRRATSRSYFFRTDLDESSGSLPALPPASAPHDGLDPSDTIYGADDADDVAGQPPLRSYLAVDPSVTLRHGDGVVIPPEAQPLPPHDDDVAHASPLRAPRRARPASDAAPLPSLEELEELAADPEATTWGDEDDEALEGDDDDLITDLPPSVMPATDEPPFEDPAELAEPDPRAELEAARAALERATRPAPPPSRPPAPPLPEPPPRHETGRGASSGDRLTSSRSTSRLEPLTLVGGDAEAQRLVRDALSRAAERVPGPDGSVMWRVPIGALVEVLREAMPDPRQAEIARLEEALAEARRELAEARGRSVRLEGGSARLDRELADARAQVVALERDLADARARAARLEDGLARARERQAEAEREVARLREAQAALNEAKDVLAAERDEARERAAGLDDDLTLMREEVSVLERELAAARDKGTVLDAELGATREQLERTRDEADAAHERGRHLEARLAAEQRVAEGLRRERDEARDELAATQDQLADVRATAARELAALSREHHEARRALERERDRHRDERARLEELVLLLLGELPDDEDDPFERPARGPRPANGKARDPRELLSKMQQLMARAERLEADRRRALLLPAPPFEDLLRRLPALRGDDGAGHPALERIAARCRAGHARYLELRDLLRRREAGARELAELAAVVREALVIEDLLDAAALAS